jgi:hypothetical protein
MRFSDFINESIEVPTDYIDFRDYLVSHGVPVDKYGTDGYKTVGHLYNEVKEGETVLTEEDGGLVRRVEFVGAKVIYKAPGGTLWLYEAKQVFKDGRTRVRDNMPYSAAEKFKAGEDLNEVLVRGMEEELGIQVDPSQFAFYNKKEVENNDDYPGIRSFHVGHEYIVNLNKEQYKPEGYIERQDDKDVYFEWRPISVK